MRGKASKQESKKKATNYSFECSTSTLGKGATDIILSQGADAQLSGLHGLDQPRPTSRYPRSKEIKNWFHSSEFLYIYIFVFPFPLPFLSFPPFFFVEQASLSPSAAAPAQSPVRARLCACAEQRHAPVTLLGVVRVKRGCV